MQRIEVNVSALNAAWDRLVRGLQDARPLMKEVSFMMADSTAENFEQGGRPKWLGLAPDRRRDSKLQRTGRLRNSIVQFYDTQSATVGTNVVYAGIHQFGGDIQHAPRSGTARLRTDARGNLLRQGGNGNLAVFAKDSHRRVRTVRWTNASGWTVSMPARPFLKLTEDDNHELELVGQKYLRGLLES